LATNCVLAYMYIFYYRSCGPRDAEILSVWWYRQRRFTYGIHWRR